MGETTLALNAACPLAAPETNPDCACGLTVGCPSAGQMETLSPYCVPQCSHRLMSPHVWMWERAQPVQPINAPCTAFVAASPFARSMTTEILISLVEIMSMFTPACASVSNNFPATPVCDFMPTPTMDSLPIFSA